jgi:hypothetical protein
MTSGAGRRRLRAAPPRPTAGPREVVAVVPRIAGPEHQIAPAQIPGLDPSSLGQGVPGAVAGTIAQDHESAATRPPQRVTGGRRIARTPSLNLLRHVAPSVQQPVRPAAGRPAGSAASCAPRRPRPARGSARPDAPRSSGRTAPGSANRAGTAPQRPRKRLARQSALPIAVPVLVEPDDTSAGPRPATFAWRDRHRDPVMWRTKAASASASPPRDRVAAEVQHHRMRVRPRPVGPFVAAAQHVEPVDIAREHGVSGEACISAS